jgi:FixJ family two-component response regulator
VQEAREILSREPVEVLVTDVHLPDGDGMSLLPQLREQQPNASAIVITGSPSMDRAITAIRGGAIDFVTKPFSNEQLIERVRSAIERHSQNVKRDKRIDRLREAVKRLNDSRKLISKKVDLLCNDLISAYGDLSRQLDNVRTKDGFRNFIANAKDLEQLLCHAMDWLLREIGYANVAVFLASDEGVFQLGAYMKYTVAGETMVTEAIRRAIIPMAVKDAIVHFGGKTLGDRLTSQEMVFMKGQDILAVNCTYLGESLACIVFFREEKNGFNEADAELLRQIAPIFAIELATVVREAESDETPFCEGDSDSQKGKSSKKRPPKKDPADWWKNGEAPPF